MKLTGLLLGVLLLAGCGRQAVVSAPVEKNLPAMQSVQLQETYKNAARGYSIAYATSFTKLDSQVEGADFALEVPEEFTQGTNLNSGFIRVKALTNKTNQEFQTCAAHKNPYTGLPLTETAVQSGLTFYHYTISDAGAGHKYIYHGYYGFDAAAQTCYHLSLELDASNVDVYEPAARPKNFDEAGLIAIFDAMFRTFNI